MQQEGEGNIKVILAKVGLSGGIYPLSLIRTCTIHAALHYARRCYVELSGRQSLTSGQWCLEDGQIWEHSTPSAIAMVKVL